MLNYAQTPFSSTIVPILPLEGTTGSFPASAGKTTAQGKQTTPYQKEGTTSSSHAAQEIRQYLTHIKGIPRITREEEASLLERIRLAHQGHIPMHLGTLAKQRLVEGHLGLVIFLVRRLRIRLKTFQVLDLIQEGNLVLVQVAQTAHSFRGQFSAYAAAAIRNALNKARCLDAMIYVPPGSVYSLCRRGQIAAIDAMQPCSLDAPVPQDEKHREGEERTLADTLVAPACRRVSLDETEERLANVRLWLARLPPRQQQVLRLRYGLDPSDSRVHTQDEIARLLHVSRSSVYCSESKGLKALRRLAAAH